MAKIMPDDRFKTGPKTGLMGGVMIAYFILILHVVLIALIGLVVIFLGGVAGYLLWIVIGGTLLISGSAFWFYRRMKKQGRELRDTLNSDIFQGKAVEVSLLDGLVTFRVGGRQSSQTLIEATAQPLQLEAPESDPLQKLSELAQMYDKGLISREEFERYKQALMGDETIAADAMDASSAAIVGAATKVEKS